MWYGGEEPREIKPKERGVVVEADALVTMKVNSVAGGEILWQLNDQVENQPGSCITKDGTDGSH